MARRGFTLAVIGFKMDLQRLLMRGQRLFETPHPPLQHADDIQRGGFTSAVTGIPQHGKRLFIIAHRCIKLTLLIVDQADAVERGRLAGAHPQKAVKGCCLFVRLDGTGRLPLLPVGTRQVRQC
jgi:hypothetical protein